MMGLQALADRWRAIDRVWVDWLPIAALLLLSQVELVSGALSPGAPSLVTGTLTVAMIVPLGWRRRAPLVVLAAVLTAVVLHALVVGPLLSFGTFLAAMLALYSVAAYRTGWQPPLGATLTAGAVTLVTQLDPNPPEPFEWIFPLVYFGGAFGAGRIARARSQRAAELADQVAQTERARDQQVRLATAEERARIARELHDIVAHSIGLMVVQAEAAEEMLARDPARANQPLQRVQTVGRQALGELRQLLGVLRADVDGPVLEPQPGLDHLPALIEQLEDSGMHVEVQIEGESRPLPPGLELSAFRIIQEALTNSRKHGEVTRAEVRVGYHPTSLELSITDAGSSKGPAPAGGHGLVGMRERVALYDGWVEAGPRAEGGYAVTAAFPLDPS